MLSKSCVSTTHHGVLIYTPQKHTLSCVILRTKGVFGEHTMVCSGNTLVFTVYRAAKRRGEYFSLGTDTEGNSCFSICQNIEMEQEINYYVTLK